MTLPFRIALVVLFTAYPATQVYFGRRFSAGTASAGYSRPDKDAIRREGRALFVAQAAVFFAIALSVTIEAVDPRLFAAFDIPISPEMRWVAAGVTALSLVGLWLVHRQLGRFWSAYLETKTDHGLVESGIYRWVRHPMYTVLMVHAVGLGLVAANGVVLVLGTARAVMFLFRIPREEAMLVSRFGDRYREYMARTGRLLPRLRPRRVQD